MKPIIDPTNNSFTVCDFIYSLEEATNPTQTKLKATIFIKGNSYFSDIR